MKDYKIWRKFWVLFLGVTVLGCSANFIFVHKSTNVKIGAEAEAEVDSINFNRRKSIEIQTDTIPQTQRN